MNRTSSDQDLVTLAIELLGSDSPATLEVASSAHRYRSLLTSLARLSESRQCSPNAVDRLLRKTATLSKPEQLLAQAAELRVADWLLRSGAILAHDPDDSATDPLLDFSATLKGIALSFEVKLDLAAVDQWILHGRGVHDHGALFPLIRKHFGAGAVVATEWSRPPAREDLGPIRNELHRALKARLSSLDADEMTASQKARISLEFTSPAGRDLRLFLNISRSAAVGVSLARAGDGWGVIARRIVDHATGKVETMRQLGTGRTPFVLVYSAESAGTQFIDGDRLAWAQAEIEADAPVELVGVISMRVNDDGESTAVGWLRDGHSHVGPLLGLGPLPSTDYRRPASEVWSYVEAAISEGIRRSVGVPSHADWCDLESRARDVDCTEYEAQQILERVVILAANQAPMFKTHLSHWANLSRPIFPAAPELLLSPDVRPPRR